MPWSTKSLPCPRRKTRIRYKASYEDNLMWGKLRKKAKEREKKMLIRKDNKEENRDLKTGHQLWGQMKK